MEKSAGERAIRKYQKGIKWDDQGLMRLFIRYRTQKTGASMGYNSPDHTLWRLKIDRLLLQVP